MRNRNLTSAWATTGSFDVADTTITFISGDSFVLNDFMLVRHNFADFDLEYFNGTIWVLLESVTNNTDEFYK